MSVECTNAGIIPLVPKSLTSNSRAEGRFDKQDFIYAYFGDRDRSFRLIVTDRFGTS